MIDSIAPVRSTLNGRYDIERRIRRDGFHTVYLAKDLEHDRAVEINVLPPLVRDESWKHSFVQELLLIARLQHPNIVPLYDAGQAGSLLYYVTACVKGETLSDRLWRERQLAIDVACSIAREVADALVYAHNEHVVHRGIEPGMILLSHGHAVVADFGVASAARVANLRDPTWTEDTVLGPPFYLAPELFRNTVPDIRNDIYSLGCVLYEMLTGRLPFFFGKEAFVARFTEAAPIASARRRDIPRWLDETIAKALERNPEDRFQHPGDLAQILSGSSVSRKRRFAAIMMRLGLDQ